MAAGCWLQLGMASVWRLQQPRISRQHYAYDDRLFDRAGAVAAAGARLLLRADWLRAGCNQLRLVAAAAAAVGWTRTVV